MSAPTKIGAAILVAQRQPLVVDEVELPGALGYGQVLVRVVNSGICGSQIGEIDGVKGPDRYLPHLLGHEGGGVVEDVGEGVSTVGVGDRVVLHWRPGDGHRAEPPLYRWRGQPLNAGWVTTFNEYAVVSEDRVTRLPPEFPLDLAALLGCAVTTGFGVIANDAAVKVGESVVVLGAGGVGLSVVQAAALASAYPIVAVDLHDSRLELARALGASHTVNGGGAGAEEEITALIGDDGVDACIETTGVSSVIELAVRLTAPQGRTVLVGVPAQGSEVTLHTLQFHFGKRLIGSHGGEARPARDIPRLVRMVEAGTLDLSRLITERVALKQVNDAIYGIRSGEIVGRCLIDF